MAHLGLTTAADLLVCTHESATPAEVTMWPDLLMAGGQRLAEVLLNMRQAMDELSEAPVRALLGGALTGAQNEGRLTAAVNADVPGQVYADETRDKNTCEPCRDIDERWLGSTDDMDQVRQHYPGGGFGGYIGCKGRERCRGTIRFEWPDGLDAVDPPPLLDPGEEPFDPDQFERELEEALQRQIADNAERIRVQERAAKVERQQQAAEVPGVKIAKAVPALGDADSARTASVTDLRRRVAAEADAVERINRSKTQGETEIVVMADGSRFISKRLKSYDGDTDEENVMYATADADKEELANLVGRAVGVDVPALVRGGPTQLYLEFVDGPIGGQMIVGDRMKAIASDAGHQLGLLDVLVANNDRNSGNWLFRDGRPVAIDHGYAWNEEVDPWGTSLFAKPFIDLNENTGEIFPRPTNDSSPADMALVRDRVSQLRPDFDRLGRSDWFDRMMGRLDVLEAAATGKRDRLQP